MQPLKDYFAQAVTQKASDMFFIAGLPRSYKVGGQILREEGDRLMPNDTAELLKEVYAFAGNRSQERLLTSGEDDFSFSIPGLSRFRVNAYRQRNSLAAVIRVIRFDLPSPAEYGIPDRVMDLAELTRGLVLVTGPAASGKSSTQACLIDRINRNRPGHIITLEDPIEYLHSHQQSIVSQREIGLDVESFVDALRAALRQAPDVILLGEMRDYETISTAITAAETGHLVISTLHTTGAANTIDRIIDAFPPNQQNQIRLQLSMVLKAIVSQQLLPTMQGGMAAAFECLRVTPAVANLVREAKISQIDATIASSAAEGMQAMDGDLFRLIKEGRISQEEALRCCINHTQMQRRLATL